MVETRLSHLGQQRWRMVNKTIKMADSEANLAKEEEAFGHGADDQPPPYNPNYGTRDAAPPSYEGSAANYNDPPPSYESLYGQIREAKQNSSGFLDFMKTFFIIIISTIGCTICVGLVLAVPVAMIVIGAMYLDDCRAEKYIPIYLIVGGVFGAIKNISNMLQRCKNRKDNDDEANAKTNPFDGLLGCFLLAWFIAGNMWVYRQYGLIDRENPDSDNYCNPLLYDFAFWVTTSIYILTGATCCCFICCNVWIYRIYGEINETDPTASNYCHPTLYYFAFWLTTVGYILMATVCCCFCCCGCVASCVENKGGGAN